MTFWNLNTLELMEFRPGILSRAETGSNLVMVCMQIAPGKEDTGHVHSFDQCGLVIEGEIEMFVEESRRLLKANDSYFIAAGLHHGWKTFDTHVKILDVSAKEQPRLVKNPG